MANQDISSIFDQAFAPKNQTGGQDVSALFDQAFAAPKKEESKPTLMQKAGDVFTGNLRKTPEMEGMTNLGGSGGVARAMEGLSKGQQAKFQALQLSMTNPDEIAKLAVAMNPDLQVRYNKNAKGEVYPILTNQKTGEDFNVMPAGFDQGDLGRLGGLGAAFSPAGLAAQSMKTLGKKATVGAITSGITQASIEGAQAAAGGDFNTSDVALATATGGLGELALPALGGGYRYVKQLVKGAPDQAKTQLVKEAERIGVPLMTTDVFQPETAITKTYQTLSERIPILGTGALRADQKLTRINAVEDLMSDFGADVGEDYAPKILESLKKENANKMFRAQTFRESSEKILNTKGNVQPTKTQQKIADLLKSESSKQIPDQAVIDYLQMLGESVTPNSFKTLRETRSTLQSKISEMYKGQNSIIGSSNAPTFTKIVGALDEDLTDFARASGSKEAYQKWRLGNMLFRDEYQKLKSGTLKNIIDKGEFEPEIIMTALNSNKPSQSVRLYANLTQDGRDNVKKLLLQQAAKKATSNATGDFSADAFATELSKKNPVVSVFFKGDDKNVVDGLVNVLRATKRSTDAALATNTGQQAGLIGSVGAAGYGIAASPVATLALLSAAGVGTRGVESKAVRNILIKLAGTPVESEAFKSLTTKLNALAIPLIQTQGAE